jgi:hypothetical protein
MGLERKKGEESENPEQILPDSVFFIQDYVLSWKTPDKY